ncbi:sugar phosphate isomerase/epimerase family protein [Desulforhopalus singaporensis]|uniref:Sugar phosphate isomerase/epimerase n=1 Tax=Desulforhopalus singaporensis TaxID=91360 RepID=A0A1H0KMP3_9BACT|nr:sugar phosphate isomerase/epimerase [Desulforhopalus singaporensis]SDO57199.1 Sugar phosphate isomerase/epimerase [Desulforhopalus singaporensis]
MTHEFSLAHLTTLSCTPPELVDIAARAGYDYVSIRMTPVTAEEEHYQLVTDRKLMKETKARLADTGILVLDVELIRLDPLTEPESCLGFLEAGAELGAKGVIAQLPDPDRKRATDRFARLCDLAAPFNLTINLEFPSWTQTPDLKAAVDVLRAVDKDNAGVLVDTLHFDRSRSSLELLRQLPGSWFNFIHLCDAPAKHPDSVEGVIHTARADRYYPGEGGIDIKQILDSVPTVPFSLEIPNDRRIKRYGRLEYARRALEASRRFFADRDNCHNDQKSRILMAVNQ